MSEPQPGRRSGRHVDFPFLPGAMPPLFGDTASVLIVEDDRDLAFVLSETLRPEGYHCTIVPNAVEARRALAEKEYSIALVDILMDGESGLELVDDVLDVHPTLAVVMVSAISDPAIAELALESGAYGYIVKPFNLNQVIVTVASAGRRRCLEIERSVYRRRLEARFDEQTSELDDAMAQLDEFYRRAGSAKTPIESAGDAEGR